MILLGTPVASNGQLHAASVAGADADVLAADGLFCKTDGHSVHRDAHVLAPAIAGTAAAATVRPALSATVATACTDGALGEEGVGRRGHSVSPARP